MPEVRMTVEEYLALMEAGMSKANRKKPAPAGSVYRTKVKMKRKGKKDPKMARALRKANSMGRKKSGGFKKGWSQGKIMRKAHQLRRGM